MIDSLLLQKHVASRQIRSFAGMTKLTHLTTSFISSVFNSSLLSPTEWIKIEYLLSLFTLIIISMFISKLIPKNMTKLSTTVLLVIYSILLVACTSDIQEITLEKSPNLSVNNSEANCKHEPLSKEVKFLAGHNSKEWHVTKYVIDGSDYTNILFKECSLDNVLTFYPTGEYIEFEGNTKCDENDPNIFDTGTFKFNETFTQWSFVSSHLNVNFDVVELSPVTFKIKYIDPSYGEVEIWLTPVFKIKA